MKFKRFFVDLLNQRLREESLPFIQVMIGPRQVGKSTAVQQMVQDWSGSSIYESADGVVPKDPAWIEHLWCKAREMPGPCLLAIDEIQKVKNWSEAVKILFDKDRHSKKLRVLLTGSASLSLQTGLTESLAGRFELVQCPHWGLDECKSLFSWDLDHYLKFGGYPLAANLVADQSRWQSFIKDSIVESVIGKDLMASVSIQKPALLRQLFQLVLSYPAQEISLQKLLGQLQDEGNTTIIKHYLEILSGGFLIKTLEKYSGSILRQKSSSPKIVPLAPALIHAFNNPEKVEQDLDWRGRVFESAIGAHLCRLPGQLYYWRSGKFEVDYVLEHNNNLYAFEIKSGRRKSEKGLQAFREQYPKAKLVMVDMSKGTKFLAEHPSLQNLV